MCEGVLFSHGASQNNCLQIQREHFSSMFTCPLIFFKYIIVRKLILVENDSKLREVLIYFKLPISYFEKLDVKLECFIHILNTRLKQLNTGQNHI